MEQTMSGHAVPGARPVRPRPDEFFVLGWVVGIAFLADIAANMGDPFEVLWFCSASAFLLTVGLFRRNTILITMIFFMAIPAQFFWIADFILQEFGRGWGRTAMLSNAGPGVYWTSLALHALLIPVSGWGVWKLGFDRRALPPAVFYGGALMVLSYFLTLPELNHNCVFYPCDMVDPGGGYIWYFLSDLGRCGAILIISFLVGLWLFRNRLVPKEAVRG